MASHSDWSAALYRGITGGLSPSVESRSLPTRLAGIERRTGSPKAAAASLGISPGTYRRWLTGKQKPNAANAGKIQAAERRARLKPGREANLRGRKTITTKNGPKGHTMSIVGMVRVSNDTRERKIRVGDYIPIQVIGRIINAWLSGNDTQAVSQLQDAIAVYYVADMDLISITKIEFN